MKYAITYQSQTGNTQKVAEAISEALPGEDCIYFGPASPEAVKDAELIFCGFWTDKGSCDPQTAAFLQTLSNKKIALFGTAGFGKDPDYFESILKRATGFLPNDAVLLGGCICQGKMPKSVRTRYEQRIAGQPKDPNLLRMLRNFDCALTHPDNQDLLTMQQFAKHMLSSFLSGNQ